MGIQLGKVMETVQYFLKKVGPFLFLKKVSPLALQRLFCLFDANWGYSPSYFICSVVCKQENTLVDPHANGTRPT
jgi:hypothetical protein